MPSVTSSTSGETAMRRTNPRPANLENLRSKPRFWDAGIPGFRAQNPVQNMDLPLPDGLPPWLAAFVIEAQRETDTLRENGAEQAAAARLALLKRLVAAVVAHLETEIDIHEAAREKGVCEETIRRAVRDGRIPDRRANPKGRHRVRRGDLDHVAEAPAPPYDPNTDAQSIAQLRRKL
jgi:hypothetical protein